MAPYTVAFKSTQVHVQTRSAFSNPDSASRVTERLSVLQPEMSVSSPGLLHVTELSEDTEGRVSRQHTQSAGPGPRAGLGSHTLSPTGQRRHHIGRGSFSCWF